MQTEPTSPVFAISPRWLIKTSKGVTSSRYVVKMLTLGLICIMLGMTVSNLFAMDDSIKVKTPYNNEYLTLGGDYGSHRNTNEAGESAASASEEFLLSSKPRTHRQTQQPSFVSKLASKISSWNPWRNQHSEEHHKQDKMDALYAQGSRNHTQEIIFDEWTSEPNQSESPPILAKITIVTGGRNGVYERALRTHAAHNRIHGYPMHTLRQSILDDVWSKPAYILSVILRELAKPEHERLQWLFWVDADTIIINPQVPAETFLPPPSWDDVHLLVCHDFNGLNNGVFPIRVHPWSVDLLTAVLSYRHYRPREALQFRDQSAMSRLLDMPKFARHTVLAPQRWFNAYQGEINETIAPFQTRPGDLLVHFAGVPNRDERMKFWLRRAEEHLPEWEVDFKHTSYQTETREFWEEERRKRDNIRRTIIGLRKESDQRVSVVRDALERWGDTLTNGERVMIDKAIEDMYGTFDNENTELDLGAIRTAMKRFEEVSKPLQKHIDTHNKLLRKEAHNALFGAENMTVSLTPTRETADSLQHLDIAIENLKTVLAAKVFDANRVQAQVQRVGKWRLEVERKLESLRLSEVESGAASQESKAPEGQGEPELDKGTMKFANNAVGPQSGNVDGSKENNTKNNTSDQAKHEDQSEATAAPSS